MPGNPLRLCLRCQHHGSKRKDKRTTASRVYTPSAIPLSCFGSRHPRSEVSITPGFVGTVSQIAFVLPVLAQPGVRLRIRRCGSVGKVSMWVAPNFTSDMQLQVPPVAASARARMAAASHSQPGASLPESEGKPHNGTDTAEGLGVQSEKAKAKADAKAKAKAEKEAKKAANVCSAAFRMCRILALVCLGKVFDSPSRLQRGGRSRPPQHSQTKMTL